MTFSTWARALGTGAVLALTMTAAPALAASSCKLTKVGSVPVTLEGNQPLVSAVVNGKAVRFVLDTGANSSVISRPGAARLGLHVKDSGGSITGLDGSSRLLQSTMGTLEMGTYRGEDVRVFVGGYADFGTGSDVVGVLGMDFLERHDLEFDFAHNVLNLYKPEDCDDAVLAYWSNTYSVAEMDEIWRGRSSIRLVVTVNGEPMHALIDSGATATLLDAGAMRRLGRDKVVAGTGAQVGGTVRNGAGDVSGSTDPDLAAKGAGPLRGIGGHGIPTLVSTFDTVSIGDETVKNAKLRHLAYRDDKGQLVTDGNLTDALGGGVDMILGADFLRSHRVYVAYSQRRIYFTYSGGPIFQTTGQATIRNRDEAPVPQPRAQSLQATGATPNG
ncbi:pepsin/retropepsin-like aspartic protease family protein [Azospirillum sp. B4]|uniref:pepsin/retropepsin-like aspartic protease family protein n=1 Tax=Azospirillum sp. B4 TaxID=95605 RepID=UPI00034C299A|nr:pepsin/retropepsin-like aspartic protease family protein [Azospirillum sp. B4]